MPSPDPTERLRFRSWRSDDFALARALWGDPAVTRLFSAAPWTDDQVRERLATEIATERDHGIQYWPVFCGDDLVGCCGLRPYEVGVPELGVHLRPPCWGRGFAREACEAVIAHAFGALGATAVFAGHHPDNEGSRKLLVRLGFRWTHDEPYAPTGRLHPSYLLERR